VPRSSLPPGIARRSETRGSRRHECFNSLCKNTVLEGSASKLAQEYSMAILFPTEPTIEMKACSLCDGSNRRIHASWNWGGHWGWKERRPHGPRVEVRLVGFPIQEARDIALPKFHPPSCEVRDRLTTVPRHCGLQEHPYLVQTGSAQSMFSICSCYRRSWRKTTLGLRTSNASNSVSLSSSKHIMMPSS
jgi:hypothetical protein